MAGVAWGRIYERKQWIRTHRLKLERFGWRKGIGTIETAAMLALSEAVVRARVPDYDEVEV